MTTPFAMSGDHLGHLFALMRLCCPASSIRILTHQASLTAAEKQALLPEHIFVQKSVSVALGDRLVLLSGLGDFRISRTQFRTLAAILGLAPVAAKQHQVNPFWLESSAATGLMRGMVSPFFPPAHAASLPFSAVVLLRSALMHSCSSAQVAVSLSLQSSLLVPAALLDELIQSYAWKVYPHIPVLALAGEEQAEQVVRPGRAMGPLIRDAHVRTVDTQGTLRYEGYSPLSASGIGS